MSRWNAVPALLAVERGVEQLRERHLEDAHDLGRVAATSSGGSAEEADERRDREPGRGGRDAARGGRRPRPRPGSRPISSRASRSAVARRSASTRGSNLPPGNAISPWCVDIVSGPLDEHDVRLAVDLEQRHEHRGRDAVRHQRDRRRRRAASAASRRPDLVEREPALARARGPPTAADRRPGTTRAAESAAAPRARSPRAYRAYRDCADP